MELSRPVKISNATVTFRGAAVRWGPLDLDLDNNCYLLTDITTLGGWRLAVMGRSTGASTHGRLKSHLRHYIVSFK